MAALLLSACSQDELAENSTALPEGEYPLQIGSVSLTAEVSEQPWTRVSENQADGMSSVWKDGDKIGVRIGPKSRFIGKTNNLPPSRRGIPWMKNWISLIKTKD